MASRKPMRKVDVLPKATKTMEHLGVHELPTLHDTTDADWNIVGKGVDLYKTPYSSDDISSVLEEIHTIKTRLDKLEEVAPELWNDDMLWDDFMLWRDTK